MKRFKAALLSSVIMFSLCSPCISAVADTSGYQLTFTIDNGTATVTGASGSGSSLDIPEKLGGVTVASIADNFFAGSIELTELTLPDTLRSIGSKAFSACPKLSSVYIGSDTSYIGDYAFSACSSLKEIIVSPQNKVYRSENGSLYKDDALLLYGGESDAVVGTGTRVIGKRAFFGRTDITSVKIPEGTEILGDYAFSGCLALKKAELPDTVRSIGTYCFLSCTALEEVKLSSSLNAIPESCFNGCTMLKRISIPDSVTYIGPHAFYSCVNLKSVYIPPTVETIGEAAFGRAYSLRSDSDENITDFLIYGKAGSSADKYASLLGMKFTESNGILLGDVDGNSMIDAKDATLTLTEYARTSAGHEPTLTADQQAAADFNSDGILDAKDASAILTYYAKSSVSN